MQDGEAWKPVPNTKTYVIDLTANPPRQLATIEGGKQPSGLAINRKGDLALIANREDKSISVLAISGKDVKIIDTIAMGDSVTTVAITPDGKHAIAAKSTANKIAWLDIDGQKVTYGKYDIVVGVNPYNVQIAPRRQDRHRQQPARQRRRQRRHDRRRRPPGEAAARHRLRRRRRGARRAGDQPEGQPRRRRC